MVRRPQAFSTYLSLPVNDIVWNAKDSLIYATVAGSAGPGLGDSLVGIDPNTGVIQKTIFVGSEPKPLAISDDGTQAFVGLDRAGALRQVNLQTAVAGSQTSLGGGPGVYNPPNTVEGLAAVPGQSNSVAVYASSGVVTIYDAGIARSKTSSGLQTYFTSNYGGLAFGSSANTLYVSSDANGAELIDGTTLLGTGGFGGRLAVDGGLVFASGGTIFNPATTPPSLVPVLPLGVGLYGSSLIGAGVVPYAAEHKSFNIGTNAAGTALTFLQRFDTQYFVLEEQIELPSSSICTAVNGTRWGQDGLAFLLPSVDGSSAAPQILLLRGPFVLPAEGEVNAPPSFTAASAVTLAAGSGNQYVTVTCTGFLPGARLL